MSSRIFLTLQIIFLFWGDLSQCIEMHFEQKDGGFFSRLALAKDQLNSGEISSQQQGIDEVNNVVGGGDLQAHSTERFTVLPSPQPVAIRVTYGPFSTKQTVPIRLLVPDPIFDSGFLNGTQQQTTLTSEADMISPLDLSAHIVTPTIPRDSPILRVLFHAGQTAFGLPIHIQQSSQSRGGSGGAGSRPQQGSNRRHRARLCLVAQATKGQAGDSVSASCTPDTRDSTCLAELTLPIHWWPASPSASDENVPLKPTKIPIQVSYAVYEPENGHCNEIGLSTTYGFGIPGEGSGSRRIQIQPLTQLSTVILTDSQKTYRVVKADASDAVKLLVPQGSLYPHTKFYVPVIVGQHDHQSIVAFIMRARVKSGLRIIGIEPNVENGWNITTDFNPRRTHATITAVRKFDPQFQNTKRSSYSDGDGEEVFNWILEASEEAGSVDDWDLGRVVWILRYVVQPTADSSWMKKDPFSNFGDERHKLTTRLEIQKDDIQAVLPIAKSWEVVNTAVLNAKQITRSMKVFIVSQAGQVADVTLQASCKSLDESVLKVSSSCTSVYVDGSEIRGSTNATISIKYGAYEGQAQFTVWMPDFPLDIQLSDSSLNQIKGWKIPNGLRESEKRVDESKWEMETSPVVSERLGVSVDEAGDGQQALDQQEPDDEFENIDKYHCRVRYQHSRTDVYARFMAQDQESGRTSYFLSRKTYLKVTDLISDFLRVVDSQVAIIKGGSSIIIQGIAPGRTEIQVVSPVTGRVQGTKEIRVLNEKVSISSMKVQVISGVQLSLYPDTDSDNEFIAETTLSSKLSAKYQEALLDIKLLFSDNTWIKLDEIEKENYVLAVDSLEPSVVELPPIQNSKYPRIIAVSEGGGPIMRVSLELSDQCHRQNSQPLAMAVANVEVNFTSSSSRSEFTQNDSTLGGNNILKHSFRKTGRDRSKERMLISSRKDLSSAGLSVNDITGIPMKDDNSKVSAAIPYGPIAVGFGEGKGWKFSAHNTPLEIAMYVLLGVFSIAILVFVASCVVYASRVKKRELGHPCESLPLDGMKFEAPRIRPGGTLNAHDWVWLGRASIALHPSSKSSLATQEGPIRITTNPNFNNNSSSNSNDSSNNITPQSCTSNLSGGPFTPVTGCPPLILQNPPPPRPPKPQSRQNSIDSRAFSGQQSPSPPSSSEYRPPVPPHKNLSSPTSSQQFNSRGHAKNSSKSPSTSSSSSSSSIAGKKRKHHNRSKTEEGHHHHQQQRKGHVVVEEDLNPTLGEFDDSLNLRRYTNGSHGSASPSSSLEGTGTRANILGNPLMAYIDEEEEEFDEPKKPLATMLAAGEAAAASRLLHNNRNQGKSRTPSTESNVKLDMDYSVNGIFR